MFVLFFSCATSTVNLFLDGLTIVVPPVQFCDREAVVGHADAFVFDGVFGVWVRGAAVAVAGAVAVAVIHWIVEAAAVRVLGWRHAPFCVNGAGLRPFRLGSGGGCSLYKLTCSVQQLSYN